ncbi:HD family phosphohydrolase [Mesohalobacter halotolerans]|uniref:HDIG domain-containing protein n=1 Tax=Mesohalobacter halotolerans TaxID=1883405 RepID=A0A4U5TQ68_9FLAO|nr:HDIG domain-containing metalloprotein [Mesohalobacter halotolerans]TKS55871.1 HDIG domain-containing protein [Mesohalobacter halotolerans]
MKKVLQFLYKNQANIYKISLVVLTVFLIVYFFPKGYKFKYDIDKNTPWPYENLYAQFDYSILKSNEELKEERDDIVKNHSPYYEFDQNIYRNAKKSFSSDIKNILPDSLEQYNPKRVKQFVKKTFDDLYQFGLRIDEDRFPEDKVVILKKGPKVEEVLLSAIYKQDDLKNYINAAVENSPYKDLKENIMELFFKNTEVNVFYNAELTEKSLNQKLDNISQTRGTVKKGSKIISKGEIVDSDKYQKLVSLKAEYESQDWDDSSLNTVIVGYVLLVSLAFLMLLLFIKKYREDIYEDNNKITFIFFNILFIVGLSLVVLHFNPDYVYVVPICILPLTLKAFFDPRLGLFTHVITVLILGFIVPNSFEYMFLQIIAGIVTILTVSELYKRANLFISVFQITLVYLVSYLAFNLIQEGSIYEIEGQKFILFLLSGVGLLFVQPLIYSYEKVFGLISDLSLLELSDTNSKILKQLAETAPGTFHHSLNVANLAEASANEIGANALLVRVGALYHDIGKMKQPTYFSENQKTSVSAHDELEPLESARIIINHRAYGIEMAKKQKLPDRIIDFIRTHHGTSLVYYFYKNQQEIDGESADENNFRYPGPKPFNKETAILMMCDSVEAASKSLKEPNTKIINSFVEKIIDKQVEDRQFLNADITFREIEQIKKILKGKLKNIYHLRVEYPE